MGRIHDPVRMTRERLLVLERRAKAKAEEAEVQAGVAETVALGQARGAAFDTQRASAGRPAPYRRRTGLDWLASKGRLTPRQIKMGALYGAAYRRAAREAALPSSLALSPGGVVDGGPLTDVVAKALGTMRAERRLDDYRLQLLRQADLIDACDRICGQELTPREAAGDERGAGRMEAVLCVALDILALQSS